MKPAKNTHNADVQLAFYVFIICILISFLQDAGHLLSEGVASIP